MEIQTRILRKLVGVILMFTSASLFPIPDMPADVKGFFVRIPETFLGFDVHGIPLQDRLRMIEVNDRKNGWLRLSGKGEYAFEGWIDIVLFRHMSDVPVIGIARADCGPRCEQTIHFLEYRSGGWIEKTSAIFQRVPEELLRKRYREKTGDDESDDDPPILYLLPRTGSDIQVVTQEQLAGKKIVLFRYRLSGGRFLLQEE